MNVAEMTTIPGAAITALALRNARTMLTTWNLMMARESMVDRALV